MTRTVKRPLTVNVAEAVEITGATAYAIRKAIDSGDLPRFGIGRTIRIPLIPLLRMCGVDDIDAAIGNGAAASSIADTEEPSDIDRRRSEPRRLQ